MRWTSADSERSGALSRGRPASYMEEKQDKLAMVHYIAC